MKANELMIGDWVSYNGKELPCRVVSIFGNSIRFDNGTPQDWMSDAKNFTPIPLTAEILEKNGFELYEQDFTSNKVYVFDKGFTYIEDCGNYFVIGVNVEYEHFGRKLRFISSTIKVYYVHELQQALRLVGVNKEITL